MKDLIIIGAGGFGREVKCLIEAVNSASSNLNFNILGFIDEGIVQGTPIHGLEVLGGLSYLSTLENKPSLVLGIGAPKIKRRIIAQYEEYDFPNIIHPTVSLAGYNIKFGRGCIICDGAILTCDIVLGSYVTINLMCTVGHDTVIKDYCSFMPSVNLSGEVMIEEGVYVGTGAKIINQLNVGANTIIGAGAVVSKSLPKDCTAVGIPAKPIKFHN